MTNRGFSFYISKEAYHPVNLINVKKKKKKTIKNHANLSPAVNSVVSAIAICVHLNFNKPQDCSVEIEDGCPWHYLSKMFRFTDLGKDLHKMRQLICLPRRHELHLIWLIFCYYIWLYLTCFLSYWNQC